jgi:Helix-turn-helix domain of transposase family ISL3
VVGLWPAATSPGVGTLPRGALYPFWCQMPASGYEKGDTEAAVLALASGRSVKEAAALAGVSETTVRRRLRRKRFRERVEVARAELVRAAFGKVADGMVEAADVLRRLLSSDSEQTRLSAAKALLSIGSGVWPALGMDRQLAGHERRLEELERKAESYREARQRLLKYYPIFAEVGLPEGWYSTDYDELARIAKRLKAQHQAPAEKKE